jgi:hypothetical protein
VVHEAGHVAAGAAYGAHPGIKSIRYAGIPFFAVTHDHLPRRREFVVSSSGFWVQHAGAEWLLSRHPRLREERAPFLKGMLALDVATSTIYAGAAFVSRGPPESDVLGMARSLGAHGWSAPAVGAWILVPAVLDGVRYLYPDQRWAAWASRGSKVAFMALVAVAGGSGGR